MDKIRIVLIGQKERDRKIIVEMFNEKNESLIRATGKTRNELLSDIRYKFNEIVLLKKPLITNGFRISHSTGFYVICNKVSDEVKNLIIDIIYPQNKMTNKHNTVILHHDNV